MSDAAPIRLIVEQVASRERTVRARMEGYNQRALVHFGDTATLAIDPNRSVLHTYTRAAGYMCSLTTQFFGRPWPPPKMDVLAQAPVIVKNGLGPVFTVTPGDTFQKEQEMTLTMEDDGTGIATFGEIHWPHPPNEDPDVFTHKVWLTPGGKYTQWCYVGDNQPLTVIDFGTGRRTDTTIDVPETQYEPDFTLAYRTAEADPAGMTLDLTLTAVEAGRKLRIYWAYSNSRDPQIIDSPASGQTFAHTYEEWEITDPIHPERPKEAAVTLVYDNIAENGDWDNDRGRSRWLEMPRPASS